MHCYATTQHCEEQDSKHFDAAAYRISMTLNDLLLIACLERPS